MGIAEVQLEPFIQIGRALPDGAKEFFITALVAMKLSPLPSPVASWRTILPDRVRRSRGVAP